MRTLLVAGALAAVLAAGCASIERDGTKTAQPQQEHAWLMKFVGDWTAEIDVLKEPGAPPERSRGTESVRAIGGFWIVAENHATYQDKPFSGIMTLGYDPDRKRYVGTWVDSMTSHLWTYSGTLDSTGRVLTLESVGPCTMMAGQMANFRETIEFKSNDHRVFTSAVQAGDGPWIRTVTVNFRRK